MNPISTTVSVQASVSVTDNGAAVDPSKVAVVWTSLVPDVATIDSNGVVTPASVGSAQIRADCTVTLASGTKPVVGFGVVNVTAVGDNLVATVDFQPIAA